MDKEFQPDGYNLGINDGLSAGQTVPHLHIHLIPRYKDDQEDPRGGVRWIIPEKAKYWITRSLAQELPKAMAAIPLNPGIIDTDMLKICFGNDAEHYPSPERWAETAVPFLLKLSARDNGKPLTVPGY